MEKWNQQTKIFTTTTTLPPNKTGLRRFYRQILPHFKEMLICNLLLCSMDSGNKGKMHTFKNYKTKEDLLSSIQEHTKDPC